MCPSHCNMSVSAYGMSLFRELGRVGRLTEQMKMWGSLAELSQAKTQGYGKRVNMAVLLPHTSMRGASKAPRQHQGHPHCALHGVPLTLSSDAGTPWNLACTRHIPPATLQPCQRAKAAPGEGEKQEAGRKANTLQRAAASQWLLQGQLAALSLRLDLITPAPVPVSCRLSASHCLRCAGQDHCHTLSWSLREYV